MTHLVAGGLAGSVAALITSPLEVVKVRLQASAAKVANVDINSEHKNNLSSKYGYFYKLYKKVKNRQPYGVKRSVKLIVATEGFIGLFRGVVPTLFGVIPSRSIYFWSYNHSQSYFNEIFVPHSSAAVFCSAAASSALCSTVTNPIWFVKTRLQLDFGAGKKKLKVWKIVKDTYKTNGIRGFFRGVTASYVGISETGINFMIYERLKVKFLSDIDNTNISDETAASNNNNNNNSLSKLKNYSDMFRCVIASMISKTIAITIAYPHEMARTRLREEGTKYTGFFQTIFLVFKEEGLLGLYRGLSAHYLRQVPNTGIIFGIYEGTVFLFEKTGIVDMKNYDNE